MKKKAIVIAALASPSITFAGPIGDAADAVAAHLTELSTEAILAFAAAAIFVGIRLGKRLMGKV
jgi:hypothetical protein